MRFSIIAATDRTGGSISMPDTTISAVDKSLEVLLQAEKDLPGYALDFCSGYVSTDGVLLLKRMLKAAPTDNGRRK